MTDIIQTILKDSNYHLALFAKDEIEALRGKIFTKTTSASFMRQGLLIDTATPKNVWHLNIPLISAGKRKMPIL